MKKGIVFLLTFTVLFLSCREKETEGAISGKFENTTWKGVYTWEDEDERGYPINRNTTYELNFISKDKCIFGFNSQIGSEYSVKDEYSYRYEQPYIYMQLDGLFEYKCCLIDNWAMDMFIYDGKSSEFFLRLNKSL